MMSITHVLCPVDFSDIAQHAVDHAAAIAHWYQARLTLLHVVVNLPTMDEPPPLLDDADRDRLKRGLHEMVAGVHEGLQVDYRVEQAQHVHDEILGQLAATHADLLVLGTHGRSGFQRLFLGSTTEKVIRKTPCATIVVPPRAGNAVPNRPVQFQRIVCAIDFSPSSLAALAQALNLAEETEGHLTLLHAIEVPPELQENAMAPDFDVDRVRAAAEAEALRRLRELVPDQARGYCTVEAIASEGAPYREILRRAAEESADLVVMGVRGRRALDLLVFGSVTHHVIRAAACPVLIVPQR